jgi:IclR family transcriptional regulator, acetate operon repressor
VTVSSSWPAAEQAIPQGLVTQTKAVPAGGSQPSASPQLLDRTFAMLSLFAADHPEWTTTELSSVSGLPVPTTHRIVVALQRHGFLVRDPATKRFRLGPAAIALGRAALSSADLPTIAGKLLPRLTRTTEETSLLTVLSDIGDTSVCLLRVESPHPLRLSVQPGRALPLHAGASQKALLAYLPEAERNRIASGPLEKFCANTLGTREALLAEIERIRSQGWSYSFEETDRGVWGVAVALLDASGHSVAAVGIAGPQVRATRASVEKGVRATADVAAEMAAALGLTSSVEDEIVVRARDVPRALRG